MQNKILDLSIILVNWNTSQLTLDCLKSVYDQTRNISFEVILIDNASSDDSVARIKQAFPQVKLYVNKQNGGFARGNNQGIRESVGRYIVLLNTDTIVLKNALAGVVLYLDNHTHVGAATPKLVSRDGSTQFAAAKDPSLWGYINEYLFHRYPDLYPASSYDKNMEVQIIPGACYFIRRDVLANVGGLSEEYFMYMEDVDWCQRIRAAGYKIMYIADYQVVHYGGESSKLAQHKMKQTLLDNRLKHHKISKGVLSAFVLKQVFVGYKFRHMLGELRRSYVGR